MEEVKYASILPSLFDTRYVYVKIHASTKSLAVYTHELIHESVLSLEYGLHIKTMQLLKKCLCIDMINYIAYYTLSKFNETPESTIVQNAD